MKVMKAWLRLFADGWVEEALRKMAEPMLAGIYASDPETMSIGSTFPMFVQTERKYRSLILGMLARKKAMLLSASKHPKSNFSLFMTLKDGLGGMVDAVIQKSLIFNFSPGKSRIHCRE